MGCFHRLRVNAEALPAPGTSHPAMWSNPQPWPWLANQLALWDWGAQHPWQALLPVCTAQAEGEVIVSTAVPGRGHSCCGLADVHVTQGEISTLVLFHACRGARCSMSRGEAPGRCQQQPRCSGQPLRPPYPQKQN